MLSADFSGNNVVDADDLQIWRDNYGTVNTATQPQGDYDDDMDVDGADFLSWQRDFGSITLVAPRNVAARALGASSIEVTWDPSANAVDYLVARRDPATETLFTAIAPNVIGTSYTDTGLLTDRLYEYLVVAQQNPSSPPSQVVDATTNQSNLTAFRPQGVYDPDDTLTPNPIYDPFPKRPVRWQDETSSILGPGIRINNDDDDNNGVRDRLQTGSIVRENDLIEVRIDRLPGQGSLVLTKGPQLNLYFGHDKFNPVLLDGTGNTTLPLVFSDDVSTVFVEWASTNHGTATLSLVDPSGPTTLDSVRFHSFESLIVAFGGNTQDPADTDGDGSIGDPVGNQGNREGIFDIAQFMYNTGWDVLAFDEEDYDASDDIPYSEVINARQNRFVQRHGVIGYSQGGGATHDLIERVFDEENIITNIGVMLDGVRHNGINSETDWPDVALYLLSIYQTHSFLRGDDIDNGEVLPGTTLEEVNTTADPGWDSALDHSAIDDDLQVGNLIVNRLRQILIDP